MVLSLWCFSSITELGSESFSGDSRALENSCCSTVGGWIEIFGSVDFAVSSVVSSFRGFPYKFETVSFWPTVSQARIENPP